MTMLAHLASPDRPLDGSQVPIMVLLHGYGSHERDLPGLTPHLPALPWASVRAPEPMPAGGAAWFPLSLPYPPNPVDVDRATSALWEWIDGTLPPDAPLLPVGFSQGGLMALQLLRTRPRRVQGCVVMAGFAAQEPQAADHELARQRPPVFWGRGDADTVIWPAAIDGTASLLPELSTLTSRVYPGLGHGVDARMIKDVSTFIAETTGHADGARPD